MDKNADACMKRPRDIRDRNLHIVREQTRYVRFRSPGNGKSPAAHKNDKSHTAAQTGLRKPARMSQNGPQCIGNMDSFGDRAAGKPVSAWILGNF